MYYIVKVQQDKDAPQYLCRGRLVSKENATKYNHPSAANAALYVFLKQRFGHITVDIIREGK